jgi:hypothetical protein
MLSLSGAWAQYENPLEVLKLSDDELDPPMEEVMVKKPEKYLRHQNVMKGHVDDSGMPLGSLYTGKERHRMSAALLLQGNYEFLNQQQGFEATYMYLIPSWKNSWWGVTARQTRTKFKFISNSPSRTSGSSPDSEAATDRPGGSNQAITQLGIGAGYRFKLLLDFFETENVFETIDVFLTTNQLDDSYRDRTFRGYGFIADYSLLKRSGAHFFYGGKFNYNLALVTREAISNETKNERSLSLGWFSLGFVIGYYY